MTPLWIWWGLVSSFSEGNYTLVDTPFVHVPFDPLPLSILTDYNLITKYYLCIHFHRDLLQDHHSFLIVFTIA